LSQSVFKLFPEKAKQNALKQNMYRRVFPIARFADSRVLDATARIEILPA
jgi:hypothetical protein